MATEALDQSTSFDYATDVSAPRNGADFSIYLKNELPAHLIRTPSDELTGQPLVVLTKPADFHENDKDCLAEFHHLYHPGSANGLGSDWDGNVLPPGDLDRAEGLAVRYSIGQVLPNWLHDHYHNQFWGPKLPVVPEDRHRAVLFGIAKVIPRQAIHIYRAGEFRIENMDDAEYDFIRRTASHEGAQFGWLKNRRGRIGSYLANFALSNYLPEIIEEKEVLANVESFLQLKDELKRPDELRWSPEEAARHKGEYTRKQIKRHQLVVAGEAIVHQAIMASTENLRPFYGEAIRANMVQGTKRDLGLVAIKFFGRNRFPSFTDTLEQHIVNSQKENVTRKAA